jgi:hypothetical protein
MIASATATNFVLTRDRFMLKFQNLAWPVSGNWRFVRTALVNETVTQPVGTSRPRAVKERRWGVTGERPENRCRRGRAHVAEFPEGAVSRPGDSMVSGWISEFETNVARVPWLQTEGACERLGEPGVQRSWSAMGISSQSLSYKTALPRHGNPAVECHCSSDNEPVKAGALW